MDLDSRAAWVGDGQSDDSIRGPCKHTSGRGHPASPEHQERADEEAGNDQQTDRKERGQTERLRR
jgi:hypothetical protein